MTAIFSPKPQYAMDSQATLVDPTELPDRYAHTELLFSRDSLTNADLVIRGGTTVVYTIRTPGKSLSRTELCHVEGAGERPVVVACIERNEILPDTIRFRDGPTMKMKSWLRHKSFAVLFPDTGEKRYTWKPTSLEEVALFDDANSFSPVAWYRSAHRREVDGVEVMHNPTLSLHEDAERIQELVIASLLVVEQKYRMKSQRVVQRPLLPYQ